MDFSWRILLTIAGIVSLPVAGAAAKGSAGSGKHAAESLAKKVASAQLKRVVVADFLEAGTQRTPQGVYLSMNFSQTLSHHAQKFDVIKRQEFFAYIQKQNIIPADLVKSEVIRRLGTGQEIDALILGRIETSAREIRVNVSLVPVATGEVIAGEEYEIPRTPEFETAFPVGTDPSGTQFYFAGMDGVGVPKCEYCPDPSYSSEARRNHIEGHVLFSALVTTEGRLDQIRLVKSAGNGLDEAALASIRTWKLRPAQGPSGQPVPVRVPIEITFRLSY